MSRRSMVWLVSLALALSPVAAMAGKKAKTAAGPQNNGNGVGIGAGGVPALRDRLEERLALAEARLTNLELLVGQLNELLAAQADRIAALEALDADDDGDGFAERAFADCDDTDDGVSPDAAEVPGNDVDEDCDGVQ